MLEGIVTRVFMDKKFGFIKGDNDSKEYFFHQTDLNGYFNDIVEDMENGAKVKVEFESVPSPRGPRASNVRRLDWPNTAV